MEHIVPSIQFIKNLRSELQKGRSVKDSVEACVMEESDEFHSKMQIWFLADRHQLRAELTWTSHYQMNLLEILENGLLGAPIFENLESLQEEMEKEFERQWKAYLESLPAKLSLPLLLLFFPAYLILLFGPLLMQFLEEI